MANALTALRLGLIPLLVHAIARGHAGAAFFVFWLAVATDYADGPIARRRGEASSLGGLLDHATDALFVAGGLGALAATGAVPAVLPVLLLLAFAQYALDSKALAGRALRTSQVGRWNGIAYYVLLGIPIVRDALGLGWPAPALVSTLGWVLVATTAVSMLDRALAWALMRRARGLHGAGRSARSPR